MPSDMPKSIKSCWIITDGSAGMENQCVGLAEAMEVPFLVKRIKTAKPWKWLPPQLWLAPLRFLKKDGDLATPPWPDLVISCGRQAIPICIAVRKASQNQTFTVHIQTPNIHPSSFDLVVVPEHDKLRGQNVVVSMGSLTRITAEKLHAEKQKFDADLRDVHSPVVTVLVGGPNRCYDVTPETMDKLCQQLTALHKNSNCEFLVTTSRRTGPENTEKLKQALQTLPHKMWSGDGENPYFAYLEKADAVIATSDSVNMICEAATAGKPVLIFPLPGGNRKFNFFHRSMQQQGFCRPLSDDLTIWTPPALSETVRIAKIVQDIWRTDQK
ncbi:mitochondrial fission ELM1 family protein [Sneathiella sp.]|jgi:mitochondrial fission protein ELM1|uniref:mitochondrial fission ELM1 family protein n=1 Tax=Sneathiella sp. TaxID=1964365 RepID=UPI0039E2E959